MMKYLISAFLLIFSSTVLADINRLSKIAAYCEEISLVAGEIMEARQKNIPVETFRGVTDSILFNQLVDAAYSQHVYSSLELKKTAKESFELDVLINCLETLYNEP